MAMPRMKQSESKKSKLNPRELLHDCEAGGSISASSWNMRERAPKRRNEEQEDLGGDTGTRTDDDVEDETFVDPSAFHVRHHGKGPATDEGDDEDEEEDLGGYERDEDEDPMDEDEDDGPCRLRVVKPIYTYPHKAVNYHGTKMTKKLQILRYVNPYASEKIALDRRF
jgi:hypothetical protein